MADDQVNVKFGAQIEGLIAGVEEAKAAVVSIREPVDGLVSSFGKLGEVIGAAFGVDYLRQGSQGIQELNERARQLGADLDEETIAALADTREKMNALGVTTATAGEHLIATLKPAIDAVVEGLTSLVAGLNRALAGANDLTGEMSPLETTFRAVIHTVRDVIAIFDALVRAIRLTLDEVNQFAQGMARAVHGITSVLGALAHGDLTGLGAAWEAGWRHSAAVTADNANKIRDEIQGIINTVRTLFDGGGRAVAGPVIAAPAKPSVAPLAFGRSASPQRRSGGEAERAAREEEEAERKEAELFAAKERLKLAEAKGNADRIAAIYDEWLAEVAAVYGKDSTQYVNLERERVEAAQRASEQRLRVLEEEYDKALELGLRETENENRAREEAARRSAERTQRAYERFAEPIERSISDTLTNAVLGIRQQGGLREALLGIEKSAVGGVMGNLVKGLGDSLLKPLFTSLFPQGGFLGGLGNLLFGTGQEQTKISLLTLIATNTGIIAGNTGVTAASTGTSAVGTGFGAIGAFSGIKSFFGWVGGLFGLQHGGIIPSAAGGWSLPAFAGATPAMLHAQEMVLPADLSQGLQNLIRSGGGAAQAAVHNHFHGPADGASIGRWFSQNRGDLAAAIRGAWDAGALGF